MYMYKINQGFISTRSTPVTIPCRAPGRGAGSGRGVGAVGAEGTGSSAPGSGCNLGRKAAVQGLLLLGSGGVSEGNRKGRELHGSVLSLHNESRENAWGKVGCRDKVLCLALEERVEM